MSASSSVNSDHDLAEAVRAACIQAAIDGYENASMSGLCAEGAFEAAIGAIRMLDLEGFAERREPKNR